MDDGPSRIRRVVVVAAGVGSAVAGLIAAVQLVGPLSGQVGVQTVTEPVPTTTQPSVNPVDRALAELREASIAFHAPTELELDEEATVRLVLSIERSIEELEEEIDELGETHGATIRVSDVMIADLSGLGFAIEEITQPTQVVAGEGITDWRWNVAPTETGSRRLHLTLSALITVNGSERPYTIRTFEAELTVRVSWPERLGGFVEENWQWLWTAILVPLALLAWRYWTTRRNGQKRTVGSSRTGTGPRTAVRPKGRRRRRARR